MKYLVLILLCFPLVTQSQSYPVHFTKMTGVDYDYDSNTLEKTTPDSWTNSFAFSTNVYVSQPGAAIYYTVQNVSDTKAFGWDGQYQANAALKDMEYAFYIERGSLYITRKGKIVGRYGKVKAGTTLEIELKNNNVYFKMRGRAIYTTSLPAFASLTVCASIFNEGGSLQGLECSLDHEYFIKPTIVDITNVGGGLNVTGVGEQNFTSEFLWGEEYLTKAEFAAEIAGLDQEFLDMLGSNLDERYDFVFKTNQATYNSTSPRKFALQYFDGSGYKQENFWLGYGLETTYTKDVLEDGRRVEATAADASVLYDSFYYSDENGWMSFQIGANTEDAEIGLVDIEDPQGSARIKYGFEFDGGMIRCLDNGNVISTNKLFNTNDSFSLEFDNGTAKYYINGELEVSYPLEEELKEYQMAVFLAKSGSYLRKITHDKPPVAIGGCVPKIVVEHYECDGSGGENMSILATYKGKEKSGCGPYTFNWSHIVGGQVAFSYIPASNAYASSIAPQGPGTYELTIEDDNGNVVGVYLIDVGFKHDWLEAGNAASADFPLDGYNNLYFGGQPSSGEGSNRLKQSVDGWIEYQLKYSGPSINNSCQFSWFTDDNTELSTIGSIKYGGSNYENTFNLNGVEEVTTDDLTGATSIKIQRRDGVNSISINNTEVIISDELAYEEALKGFARMYRMHVVETASSYGCAQPQYANLQYTNDGGIYRTYAGKLYYTYENEYIEGDTENKFRIYNSSNEMVYSWLDLDSADPNYMMKLGQNYFDLPLPLSFAPNQVYTLEMENLKGEKQYLKFKY